MGIALQINNGNNVTIKNMNFISSRIKITSSSDITIINCHFSGGGTGTQPGFTTFNVNGLTVLNNTFTGNASMEIESSSGINVGYNTFTDVTYYAQAIHITSSSDSFTVSHNTFVRTIAYSAICVNQSSSGGDVSWNTILGGIYNNPIYVSLGGLSSYTVNNNLISGVLGACGDFYGWTVSGVSSTSLVFSNNVFENFFISCPASYLSAILITSTSITEMSNNIVNNVTFSASNSPKVLAYMIYINDCSGSMTNTAVTNIFGKDLSSNACSIIGIYQSLKSTDSISLTGVLIQNLQAEKTPDCTVGDLGCASAIGSNVDGIYVYGAGSKNTATNIFMNNLIAGDGGLVYSTTNPSFNGGYVQAFIGDPAQVPSSITISNFTVKNFKAGDSGGFYTASNATKCANGGYVVYYSLGGQAFTPNGAILSSSVTQLDLENCVYGKPNCNNTDLVPPANAVATPSRTTISFSWSPVAGASYSLDISTSGTWTNRCNGTSTSCTVTGLTPVTTYHARVCAIQNAQYSPYTYFILSTAPTSVPSKMAAPTYKEFSTNSITLQWTASSDDGGFPITGFTLQMLNNSVWANIYSGLQTQFKVNGLSQGTAYQFRIADSNANGTSDFSYANISTAARMCGDGSCDSPVETCANCFLDCGSCSYPPCPGTPACNGGTCSNGVCSCPIGSHGSGCEINNNNPVMITVSSSSPSSTVAIQDQEHTTTLPTFTIGFHDIQELDASGNMITSMDLTNIQYTTHPGSSNPSWSETIYNVTLPNKAVITVYLYVVVQDSTFSFANQTLNVSSNSVKYSMEIINWPFGAYSHYLKVSMASKEVSQSQTSGCVASQTDTDKNNLLWIQANLNGAVMYATFAPKAELDGAARLVQFQYNPTNSMIEITIPHFWNYVDKDQVQIRFLICRLNGI
eukprot:Phypoly_transcript_01677.p1 GENE.Phypoly_transcript_01677~~Phypoly_transcript_01677.p1  ORF type:complete len:933 (+),score=93.38 Phypoly_transcript_01677:61-2799(+)